MKHYTLQDIKRENNLNSFHFFDSLVLQAAYVRKVFPEVYQGTGGVYFITGEHFYNVLPHVYTVRVFEPDTGYVKTAEEHFGFTSKQEAIKCAQALACGKTLDKTA